MTKLAFYSHFWQPFFVFLKSWGGMISYNPVIHKTQLPSILSQNTAVVADKKFVFMKHIRGRLYFDKVFISWFNSGPNEVF